MNYNGVVNLLKPPGMSSQYAVNAVKRLLGVNKAGHTGTLDPGAAGVLPVCLGKATRLFDYLVDKDKRYIAEITFGKATDTIDSYGKIIDTCDKAVETLDLNNIIQDFVGTIKQIPPAYSAINYEGKRLYQLALKGIHIDIPARDVCIDDIKVLQQTGESSYLLDIKCGRGTYIRSLCRDIGEALGTCAFMSLLIRASSGKFIAESALSIEELESACNDQSIEKYITSIEEILCDMPKLELKAECKKKVDNGVGIPAHEYKDQISDKEFLLYCCGFKGIGHVTDDQIKIKTLLV